MITKNEYDSPWKDALDLFFEDAIAFFFPQAHAQIDWTNESIFLDKELQKITADAALGRRTADKLVEVRLVTGEPLFVLVHIEVQNQWEAGFAERIYVYHYRIFDRFRLPVASFVVLSDENPDWRPAGHRMCLLGTALRFEFPAVKLLDYREKSADLEQSSNPFAIIVLAHLAALDTRNDPPGRLQRKWHLTRPLYERGFEKSQVIALYRFLDWVLNLPEELALQYDSQLTAYEEERRVKYITSIERHGMERGIEKGSTGIVLRLLDRRFGELEEATLTSIRALPLAGIESLADALLTFESRDDLTAWLDQHPVGR